MKRWVTEKEIYQAVMKELISNAHKKFELTYKRKPDINSKEDVAWMSKEVKYKLTK